MSALLWTACEAAAATGGMLCARGGDEGGRWIAEEWTAGDISIDTRTMRPGDIFVALRDIRDGHEFVADAFRKGACAALVERAPDDPPDGAPFLVVGDALEGLRALARAARERNFGRRIAVTGSAGKTTTKEMLRAVMAAFGKVHAADKSFNNHFGVPLTLARMPVDSDFGVFEIGMNHAGEIRPLSALVAPEVALITSILPAHLGNLGSMEAIAREKSEIFAGLTKGGAAILPADSEYAPILEEAARRYGVGRIIRFGESASADLVLTDYRTENAGGVFKYRIDGAERSVRICAAGRHNAGNALAVLAAVSALGLDPDEAGAALSGFAAGAGRGLQEEITLPGGRRITLLDESYNANPGSMRAALSVLGGLSPARGGRRVAVLGDMLELGADEDALHAGLAEPLVAAGVESLYVAGARMRRLWDAAPAAIRSERADAAAALAPAVLEGLQDGDIVMVKGSNGSRVHEIAAALKSADATRKTA